MSIFSFIHAADIHLDSPLRGLEQYEGAPVERIRNATRDALINLIDTAIERKVDFIIIAGDLYDGDWKDFNTGLFFISQMVRLQKENIKVFLIRGNHDAASVITRELKLPNNVYEFPTNKAHTVKLDDLKVALHGQGFAKRAVTENIVKQYPNKIEGYLNIGILHTSATGREGHETYAPCSIEDMKEKGYDYWALGHIHQRELLHDKDPIILFPGNIQGRHIKETGNKGCTFVEVNNQVIQSMSHIPLDVLRWERCEVDATGMESLDELMEAGREILQEKYDKAEGRFLAIRFVITGSTKIHQQLIVHKDEYINNFRSLALEVGYGDIWVEKVKFQTSSLQDVNELKTQHTPIASVLDYIEGISKDEDALQEILQQFHDLQKALPLEVRNGEDELNFNDPSLIKTRMKDAEQLIVYYLSNKGVEV